MNVKQSRVSERGQMTLPAEVRRRRGLVEGGVVEIADLEDALLIVPAGQGGLRALLRRSVEDAGGYAGLAGAVGADDSDLA